MKTIYKQELTTYGQQVVNLPVDAHIIHIDTQRGYPCMWYTCYSDSEKVLRKVYCLYTGEDIPDEPMDYLGTVLLENGELVLHYFMSRLV